MQGVDRILVNLDSLSQRNYFIPSYQRGYRWGKQQVVDLLDDILDYANGKGLGSGDQGYYCLQPVVVKSLTDEEKRRYDLEVDRVWYEVIDGQQRLTTLALIRHYFNEYFARRLKHPEPIIEYETRETHIGRVRVADNGDVVCDGVDRSSNIDLYHVVNAYGYIHEWFQSFLSSGGNEYNIMSVFNEQVKVIWYQIDEHSGANTECLKLYVGDAAGKEHEVSIHGAQALKIYDSMTDDDIVALIADIERRVAEVQSAKDPFNMAGAEA